jgi:hypothetical protein
VPAEDIITQHCVGGSLKIVIQRLVTGGSGKIKGDPTVQQPACQGVDINKLVVSPTRRDIDHVYDSQGEG